jgi:hypothetical protein
MLTKEQIEQIRLKADSGPDKTPTPRTDEMIDSCGDYEKAYRYQGRFANFARQLETELAAKTREVAEVKALIEYLDAQSAARLADSAHWKAEAERMRELLERMSHWDQFHPAMTGDHSFWKNEISKVLDDARAQGGES